MIKNKGILFVISGPSGVGKGTIVKELLKNNNIVLSVSATTRPPREGERHGVEYNFLSENEFNTLIDNNGFLEYACYCGNYYGTPKKAVEDMLDEGKDVILEIEVKGAENIRNTCPESISLFIAPPSMDELRSRLLGRGTEKADVVENRLKTACEELKQAEKYDYIVINDNIESCTDNILSIINSQHFRSEKMLPIIKGEI